MSRRLFACLINPILRLTDDLRAALENTNPAKGKRLKVLFLSGHGSSTGNLLCLKGDNEHFDTAPLNSMTIICPTWFYYDGTIYDKRQNNLILDSIAPLQTTTGSDGRYHSIAGASGALSNLQLVIIVGCSQGSGGLANEFVTLGAQSVIVAGSPTTNAREVSLWLIGPPDKSYKGFMDLLQTQSVYNAAAQAQTSTIKFVKGLVSGGGLAGVIAANKYGKTPFSVAPFGVNTTLKKYKHF